GTVARHEEYPEAITALSRACKHHLRVFARHGISESQFPEELDDSLGAAGPRELHSTAGLTHVSAEALVVSLRPRPNSTRRCVDRTISVPALERLGQDDDQSGRNRFVDGEVGGRCRGDLLD